MVRNGATHATGFLTCFTANGAAPVLLTAMSLFYVVAPLLIYLFVVNEETYLQMALLAGISVLCIHVGSRLTLLDRWMRADSHRVAINADSYIFFFFLFFLLFMLLTLGTAPSIPLLSALAGGDASSLSGERGEFLKGREGPWVALAYLSSLLTSTVVPYCIVVAYATRNRLRHAFLALLFVYSISFLVKALFLNLILPLIAFGIERGSLRPRQFLVVMGLALATLVGLISLSGYGSLDATGVESAAEYFTAAYIPGSTFDFLAYRSLAIPVFSVVDTLLVHKNELGGDLLWGTTSSLIAAIGGVERVNIEKMVAAYQYGGWNDLANSNVVFIADGYINFGLVGVIAYGLFIGLTFRIMRLSQDVGVRSLALLYALMLYSSPLLGMLFSNGFALFFLHAAFIRLRKGSWAQSSRGPSYQTDAHSSASVG
jgi:hypothetical protein